MKQWLCFFVAGYLSLHLTKLTIVCTDLRTSDFQFCTLISFLFQIQLLFNDPASEINCTNSIKQLFRNVTTDSSQITQAEKK